MITIIGYISIVVICLAIFWKIIKWLIGGIVKGVWK